MRKLLTLFLVGLLCLTACEETTTKTEKPVKETEVKDKPVKEEPKKEEPKKEEPKKEEPKVSVGKVNALLSAESYLATIPFSKKGLIKQLKFEKFSTEEAEYAANNVNADWMDQAVLTAQNYLDTMPFSKKELIKQLEFEGFTKSQAKHGAEEAYK